MATKFTDIPVACYELPPFDPSKGPPKAKPMRPSPLESFKGRFGRVEDKNAIRQQLKDAGHDVHSVGWGHHPDSGVLCALVYIWAKGAKPTVESKPVVPPPRPRRTATSRRHAPRPETRKKQ